MAVRRNILTYLPYNTVAVFLLHTVSLLASSGSGSCSYYTSSLEFETLRHLSMSSRYMSARSSFRTVFFSMLEDWNLMQTYCMYAFHCLYWMDSLNYSRILVKCICLRWYFSGLTINLWIVTKYFYKCYWRDLFLLFRCLAQTGFAMVYKTFSGAFLTSLRFQKRHKLIIFCSIWCCDTNK